jgi:hypothetical protein
MFDLPPCSRLFFYGALAAVKKLNKSIQTLPKRAACREYSPYIKELQKGRGLALGAVPLHPFDTAKIGKLVYLNKDYF